MRVNCPEEGHYWMRYIRGGPKVPVRIWRAVTPDPDDPTNPMDRSPMMRCKVAGREEIDYEKIVDIGVYRVTAAERMTPAPIAAVQKPAREWRPRGDQAE